MKTLLVSLSLAWSMACVSSAWASVQIVIAGGHVKLADDTHLVCPEDESQIDVKTDSTLTLGGDSTVVTGDLMVIDVGGLIQGCGTLDIDVMNKGTILANCGTGSLLLFDKELSNEAGALLRGTGRSEIEFGLSVLNRGLIQLLGDSFLTFDGGISFNNSGIIDLLNGDASTLPAGFSPGGTLYTPDRPQSTSISQNSDTGDWTIGIDGIQGHRYELCTRTSLAESDNWTSVDSETPEESGPIVFEISPAVPEDQRFWKIKITDN